jgi:hypothetical protein
MESRCSGREKRAKTPDPLEKDEAGRVTAPPEGEGAPPPRKGERGTAVGEGERSRRGSPTAGRAVAAAGEERGRVP